MDKIIISKTETDDRIVVRGSEIGCSGRAADDCAKPGMAGPPQAGAAKRGPAFFLWALFAVLVGLVVAATWFRVAEGRRAGAVPSVTPSRADPSSVLPATAESRPAQPESESVAREKGATEQTASLKELFKNYKHRAFIIQDSVGQGSGALLLEDEEGRLIATARHVVAHKGARGTRRMGTEVMVAGFEAPALPGGVVGWHQKLDLALIWLPGRQGEAGFHQPILESARIDIAEPVWTIGHPMGQTFSLSDGKVTRLPADGLLQINTPLCSGNSGGPLYNLKGNLLGIVCFASGASQGDVAQNLNFAVCADAFLTTEGWHLESVGAAKLAQFAAQRKRSRRREERAPRELSQKQQTRKLCQASM